MSEEKGMKLEEMAGGKSDQVSMGGGGGGILLKKGPRRERLGCATTAKERISKMPPSVAGKRSSIYRGVTRHRWTGRYEAHLWDKGTWNQNQNKKGKQVYLGAYDDEEAAARAYDLAALKYWGSGTLINFPVSDYSRDLEEMQNVSKEEYLASLRRKSSAFSRGFSKCRGISRNLQTSRLEASLGQILGSDCCNSLNLSCETESMANCANDFCAEGKIDLTGYIRWWIPKRIHHFSSLARSHEDRCAGSEDSIHELRVLECNTKPTEPYQLPSLGLVHEFRSNESATSATALLGRSVAFKNFQQKIKDMGNHDGACSNSKENLNGNSIPVFSHGDGIERFGTSLPIDDLALQRAPYSRSPLLLSMPVKTDWDPSAGPVPDQIFWTSLLPTTSLSLSTSIQKEEEASYGYHC